MPWYKVTVNYGGGHQACHESFEYRHVELDEDGKEDLWDAVVHDHGFVNAQGDVTLVEKLPAHAKIALRKRWNAQRAEAERMLRLIDRPRKDKP